MLATGQQLTLLHDRSALAASLDAAAAEISTGEFGAVFTKRWVVDLILDLVGYTADRDLAAATAIEPACGGGSFLVPMVERLSDSCRLRGRPITDAAGALRACDLQPANVAESRTAVEHALVAMGRPPGDARALAEAWITHDDFLLCEHAPATADFVIGNPPYIRLESVAPARSAAYRRACDTMAGRSDVYVGFFEIGLKALKPGGALGFICADRWMRNQYGRGLRQLVARGFSLDAAIELHDVDAFDEEVSAYPSITVVRRGAQGAARVANTRKTFDAASARRFRAWALDATGTSCHDADFDAATLPAWFNGGASWPTGSPARLAALGDLERRFPALEDDGTDTRVGIGVATGADRVFVVGEGTAVEPDRIVPLAMTRDTTSGSLTWSKHYLVDPWDGDSGDLVDLGRYPLLRAYLESHAETLRRRNVAARQPAKWYRTIDRVNHSLIDRPKLLIPDIKADLHPVIDPGGLYPHHNLYYVVSGRWDACVLGGLLLSRVAQMFVESYAVRMRGGCLRFQAQYLRRIRVPPIDTISATDAADLTKAFETRDRDRATHVALRLYGLPRVPE